MGMSCGAIPSIAVGIRGRNVAPSFNLSRNFEKGRLHPLYLIPDINIFDNQRENNLKYKSILVIVITLPLLLHRVENKSLLRGDRRILESTWWMLSRITAFQGHFCLISFRE